MAKWVGVLNIYIPNNFSLSIVLWFIYPNIFFFSCVEFFVEENPAISISQLVQQALEQWELSDLSDSVIKCLPDSIFDKTETHNINGIFPLQMQFLLDISESAYDQLQRLQNKEIEVGKEKPEFKQKNQKIKKYVVKNIAIVLMKY